MTRLSSTNFENFTSSYLFVQREDLSRNFLPTFARLNQAHRAELRLICTAGTTASRNDQVFQIRSEINREKKTLLDFRATVRTVQTRPGRVFLYKVFLVFPLSSVCVRARVQVRRSIETSNSRSIRSVLRGGQVFLRKIVEPGGKLVDGVVCGFTSVSPRQGWWLLRAKVEEIRRQFN